MTESINQPIQVLASFKLSRHGSALVTPIALHWRGRRYRITTLGLRYPAPQGSRVIHRFTLTANDTLLEVEFDAQTLTWTLIQISDNLPT